MSNGGERERVATDVARPGPRQDPGERGSDLGPTSQDAGNLAVGRLNMITLRLPFYPGSDPLAHYTVLREASPTAWALLARTARAKTLPGPDQPMPAKDDGPRFTETWVPVRLLVRPRLPQPGREDLRTRLWPLVTDPNPDQRPIVSLIQEEIVGRWAEQNAGLLDREVHVRLLEPEDVEAGPAFLSLDPNAAPAPPPSVLEFDLDGIPLESMDGSLSPLALDLLGSNNIETIVKAVSETTTTIATAGDLLRATNAMLEHEEQFWDLVDSNPDGVSQAVEAAHLSLFFLTIHEGSGEPWGTSEEPEKGPWIETPLGMIQQTFLGSHPEFSNELAPGQARLNELRERAVVVHEKFQNQFAYRMEQLREEQGPITSESIQEVRGRVSTEWEQGEHFVAAVDWLGYAIGSLWNSTANAVTGNFYETKEALVKSYGVGAISFDDLREVEKAAAGRAAIVGFVTIALTLATAGLGAGVPGLTATLGRSVLFSGAAGGVTNVLTMTTSTIVTRTTDFEDPVKQAAWARGAHSPGEIALGGLTGFALGGAFPVAGAAFGKLFSWLRAGPALRPPSTGLVTTGSTAVVGEFAPPPGWIAEEVAPGLFRFTHPDVPGQILSNGQTLRIQTPAGTGMLETEIPLRGAAQRPGALLAAGDEAAAPIRLSGPDPQSLLTAGTPEPVPGLTLTESEVAEAVTPRAPRRIIVASKTPPKPRPTDVWVNPNTDVYHLPGSRWYMQNTKVGRLMPLEEAERLGYRQAGTPRAQVLAKQVARAKAKLAAGEGVRSANVEAVGLAESRLAWHGTDTPSLFARHQQSFTALADIMDAKAAQLAATGERAMLPAVNREVLSVPVDEFIRTSGLDRAWRALSLADRTKFLGEIGAGNVGARVPDIAEFFLAERRIVLTDITEDVLSPLHRFKSDFYKAVMRRICGPRGPAVWTQDINPERVTVGSTPR